MMGGPHPGDSGIMNVLSLPDTSAGEHPRMADPEWYLDVPIFPPTLAKLCTMTLPDDGVDGVVEGSPVGLTSDKEAMAMRKC